MSNLNPKITKHQLMVSALIETRNKHKKLQYIQWY